VKITRIEIKHFRAFPGPAVYTFSPWKCSWPTFRFPWKAHPKQ
jgi:hypothetical protein